MCYAVRPKWTGLLCKQFPGVVQYNLISLDAIVCYATTSLGTNCLYSNVHRMIWKFVSLVEYFEWYTE